MLVVLYTLGGISLLFGIVPIFLSLRFKRYVDARLNRVPPTALPPVTVIVPCKGTDLEFRENIHSVLDQDYPDYEIVFVTGTEDDPAHHELADIIAERVHPQVKLVVAGLQDGRAQKLTNLMQAYEHVRPPTEVLVHLDADIRLRRDFLRCLVAPLRDETVGATTGFPWYLPRQRGAGSILRSIWGAGALPLLIDSKRNFAAGAANAITRETYERGAIRQAMAGSVSDTFAITNSVRKLGKRVAFVPRCLFVTPDASTLAETLQWTNRQTIISRVYSPTFWWTVTLTYCCANALLLGGLGLLAIGLLTGQVALVLPSLLILGLVPLEMLNASILLGVVIRMLPEHAQELGRLRWKYYLLTPVGSVLILVNALVSITTNEIDWRGIRYRLVSPTRTEVLERD